MTAAVAIVAHALAFFTRIPVPIPGRIAYNPDYQRKAACLWPLVGWLIGGFTAAVLLLAQLLLPLSVSVVIALSAAVWLTGALHEDGFADVCDGFGSGAADPARILTIMKDPSVGSMASLGLCLLLLLKFTALWEIAKVDLMLNHRLGWLSVAAVVNAHALSRLLAVSFIYSHRYVSSGQRSGSMTQPMPGRELTLAAVWGGLPLTLFAMFAPQPALLIAAVLLPLLLVRVWLARLFQRRLNGYSGDCLGAAQQLGEATVYLGICAVLAV